MRLCRAGVIALGALLWACFGTGRTAAPTLEERRHLAIVRSSESTAADLHFEETALPGVLRLAREFGLPTRHLTTNDPLPAFVRTSPSIVLVTQNGVSVFEGRTTDEVKLRQFLRVAGRHGVAEQEESVQDGFVWDVGRARTFLDLKLTPTTGRGASEFDEQEVRLAVGRGMKDFSYRRAVTRRPGDRSVHLDLHPWVSAAGELCVSAEIFSSYDCDRPVYVPAGPIARGNTKFAYDVFAEAARAIEPHVVRFLRAAGTGDAFDPIPSEALVAAPDDPAWSVGAVEPPPELAASWPVSSFAGRWTSQGGAHNVVSFRFPPPLGNYFGEVGSAAGWMDLAVTESGLRGSGVIEVDLAQLSMGNETLDGHLHEWFRVEEIPMSRLEFRDALIPWSETDTWHGSLTLVGKTVDVPAQGRLVPAREGSPDQIVVSLEAKIRLAQPFGLRGPEGPFPENDTVIVHAEIPFTRE